MHKITAMMFVPTLLAACGSTSVQDEKIIQAHELSVGFLIVDGVYNTELVAPFDVFQHSIFHTDPGMKVFTVAPSKDPVTTFEGLRIHPDYDYEHAPPIDVLVIPSAEHSMDSDLEDQEMMDWVRRTAMRSRYVITLCDGAFVLAHAGLLNGRLATTFPSDIPRFRAMFPDVRVVEGVSFVHDGAAITSAGGAKSYDAALYVCEKLYGPATARGIANGLVIDWDVNDVAHAVADSE